MAREKIIPRIRVTEEERETILENAAGCSMSPTAYLRALGLNTPVHSTLDKQLVLELMKINADQGRLGGLLKLWLSGQEKGTQGMTIEIRSLLKEIEETQALLKTYIRSLK